MTLTPSRQPTTVTGRPTDTPALRQKIDTSWKPTILPPACSCPASPLPHSSATHSFNSETANIARGERVDGEQILQNWFGGHIQAELFEEVVGLGGYGRTLTALTASDLPDLEEIKEEEEL